MKEFINFGNEVFQAPSEARFDARMGTIMFEKRVRDKTVWFSMWFLASIATFGLASFPLFYQLVERRNKHFLRQKELENQLGILLRKENSRVHSVESFPVRNSKMWAASIVLVLPAFIIIYILSRDLALHEKHQQSILGTLFPEIGYVRQTINVRIYVALTIATLGVGIIYWLYKIISGYNYHFRQERKIEDQIVRLIEEKSYGESLQ